MASELLKRKVENIDKIKPDFISAGNIGCITQIATGSSIPIVHTIELLDCLKAWHQTKAKKHGIK